MVSVTTNMKTSGVWDAVLSLNSEDILVADGDVLQVLTGSAKCKLATRDEALRLAGISGRIIVMLRQREWQVCKKLCTLHEKASIHSFTYELLPAGLKDGFQYSVATKEAINTEITLYLMPYGADTPYIIRLLKNARGMSVPSALLDMSIKWWFSEISDLSLHRLINAILQHKEQKHLFLWLDYSFLLALQKAALLSTGQMATLMARYVSKIVCFLRRDKCEQAVMLSVTEQKGMTSLWDAERKFIKGLIAPDYDFSTLFASVQELVAMEACIESVLEKHENFRVLTQEDLVFNPAVVLSDVAMFVGGRAYAKMKRPDYRGRYEEVENLHPHTQRLKKDIIKELGLIKNKFGSYETETQRLLKLRS